MFRRLVAGDFSTYRRSKVLPRVRVRLGEISGRRCVLERGSGKPNVPRSCMVEMCYDVFSKSGFEGVRSEKRRKLNYDNYMLLSRVAANGPTHMVSYCGRGNRVGKMGVGFRVSIGGGHKVLVRERSCPTRDAKMYVRLRFGRISCSLTRRNTFRCVEEAVVKGPRTGVAFESPSKRGCVFGETTSVIPVLPGRMLPRPGNMDTSSLVAVTRGASDEECGDVLASSLSEVSGGEISRVSRLAGVSVGGHPGSLAFTRTRTVIGRFGGVGFVTPPASKLVPVKSRRVRGNVGRVLGPRFMAAVAEGPMACRNNISFVVRTKLTCNKSTKEIMGRREGSRVVEFTGEIPLAFSTKDYTVARTLGDVS